MKIQRIPKYPFPNNENINRMQTAVDETRGVFRTYNISQFLNENSKDS